MSVLDLKLDNWVYNRLAEPFEHHEISFRTGGSGTLLAYIDARVVVSRLNAVVGAGSWHDSYESVTVEETVEYPLDDQGKTVAKPKRDEAYRYDRLVRRYGGIKCDLTVLGLTKSDLGSPSYADQLKGAASDALKRAAVKFGIGAYLYDLKGLKGGRVENYRVVEPPELPEWALPVDRADPKDAILALVEKVNAATLPPELRTRADAVIQEVMVMGRYDSTAPLIVQRAVYEELTRLAEMGK